MADLAAEERAKYEAVWRHDAYRQHAPGEAHVQAAIDALGMSPGDSVLDFGCGTGRAAQAFQGEGFDVRGVDHAHNCLDADVDIDFVLACLWDLPTLTADWGFCTDVMEHIPPEQVDAVLAGIRRSVTGCYFQIATEPDVMGRLVGQPLHLTVKPAAWWAQTLGRHWDTVLMGARRGAVVAICR